MPRAARKFHGLYINVNLTCGDPVVSPYYSKKLGPTVCHRCAQLIDDPELVSEIAGLKLTHSVVLPSCGDKTCGKHITKRKRKRALKKPSQEDRKRKKRKMKQEASNKQTPAWLQNCKQNWSNIRNKVKEEKKEE